MEDRFTDKNTVDQAWNAMRNSLDREMPIKEKKRRFAFFPFLLGGMMLLGVSFMLYYSLFSSNAVQDLKNVPARKTTLKEMVSNESLQRKENKIKSEIKKSTIESVAISKASKTKSAKTSAHSKESKQVQNNKAKIATVDVEPKRVLQNAHFPAKNNLVMDDGFKSVSSSFVSKNQLSKNKSAIVNDIAEKKKRKKIVEVPVDERALVKNIRSDYIAAPELAMLTSFTISSMKVESVNVKVNQNMTSSSLTNLKVDWAINLYGMHRIGNLKKKSVGFGIPTTDLGVVGGMEVLFSTRLNSNWRIGSGLGYKFSSSTFGDIISSGGSTFDPDASFGGAGPGTATSGSQIEIETAVSEVSANADLSNFGSLIKVAETHFISVPIFVERNLSNRWIVEGGVRYNQKVGNFGSVFLKEIRKSNFDFFLTPRFRFSKRWSVGLNGQFSTNQFNHKDTIITKEFGKVQLGLSIRIRI